MGHGGLGRDGEADRRVAALPYRLAVRNPDGIPVRLNLSCDNHPGRYELAVLALRAGSEAPLEAGETLETGTVPLVDSTAHAGRAQDYVAFLLDRELDYVTRMRKLLREELGARQMIVCTQVSYGGPCGLIREGTTAELIDNQPIRTIPKRCRSMARRCAPCGKSRCRGRAPGR